MIGRSPFAVALAAGLALRGGAAAFAGSLRHGVSCPCPACRARYPTSAGVQASENLERNLERARLQALDEACAAARIGAAAAARSDAEAKRDRKAVKAFRDTLSGAYGRDAQDEAWNAALPQWRIYLDLARDVPPAPSAIQRDRLNTLAAHLAANQRFLAEPWRKLLARPA